MKNIKLALLNIKMNFKNAKELKSSFITSIVGMILNNSAFIFIWYNFGKLFGDLNGWTSIDIFALYGFSTISYGLVHSFLSGIFNIPSYISSGNFDKYLLTPKNTLLKIATSQISTSAVGDLLFGLICFVIYSFTAKITFIQIIVSLLFMILASIIYFAFSLICMSISFYLMDGENVSSGFYGLFLSTTLYHGGAFTGLLRFIFTFVVPSLLVGVVPVELMKNISVTNVLLLTIASIIWLTISVLFFYKSKTKYESNNFFGFSG